MTLSSLLNVVSETRYNIILFDKTTERYLGMFHVNYLAEEPELSKALKLQRELVELPNSVYHISVNSVNGMLEITVAVNL